MGRIAELAEQMYLEEKEKQARRTNSKSNSEAAESSAAGQGGNKIVRDWQGPIAPKVSFLAGMQEKQQAQQSQAMQKAEKIKQERENNFSALLDTYRNPKGFTYDTSRIKSNTDNPLYERFATAKPRESAPLKLDTGLDTLTQASRTPRYTDRLPQRQTQIRDGVQITTNRNGSVTPFLNDIIANRNTGKLGEYLKKPVTSMTQPSAASENDAAEPAALTADWGTWAEQNRTPRFTDTIDERNAANLYRNMGGAFRQGLRTAEKGLTGAIGGINDTAAQLTGISETDLKQNLEGDIELLEKISREHPALVDDVTQYLEKASQTGRPNAGLHLKLVTQLPPADFSRLVNMATYRNPSFYLGSEEAAQAQDRGMTGIQLQRRQIPQQDEQYARQKELAPDWQKGAMTLTEQMPTQAANIAATVAAGPAAGAALVGINTLGNSYIEAQEKENNPAKSLATAGVKAAIDAGTSAVPLGSLAGGVKTLAAGGVKNAASALAKQIGTQVIEENLQEQASLLGSKLTDQAAYGDGGWETYGQEAAETLKTTTIATLFFSGMTLGASAAYGSINPGRQAQIREHVNAAEQKMQSGELTRSNFETDPDVKETAKLAVDAAQEAEQAGILNRINEEQQAAEGSAGQQTDAEGHTPQMQKTMREYDAAVDEGLVNFVEYATKNPQDNKTTYIMSEVSPRAAEDINNLTGIDVEGFDHSIKTSSVRHIEDRHGLRGKNDRSMSDINDVARMQYVLDNYDNVELLPDVSDEFRDKNQRPTPMVRFSKRVNGNYYVVEAVPDTKKHQLAVVSAYKNKASQQERNGNNTPPHNVRNVTAGLAFNNNISQNDNGVKEQSAGNDDTSIKGTASMQDGTKVPSDGINAIPLEGSTRTEQSPQAKVDRLVSDPSINTNISQNNNGVNIQSMQNAGNYATLKGFDGFEQGERARVSQALGQNIEQPIYAKAEATTREQKRLARDLKKIGVNAEFFEKTSNLLDETGLDINGAYRDGTVYINTNAENPYRVVAGHELTHRLKENSPELYQKLENMVSERVDDFANIEENAREEMAADLMGELLDNPQRYREFLGQNPNLVQRVLDTIREWLRKLSGNVTVGERSDLMQYMQGAEKELVALLREGNANNRQAQTGARRNSTKYSPIRYDRNRQPYVEITEDIFQGHEGEKPHSVIRNYLREHIGEYANLIESGQKVYFGKDLPGEYAYSKSAKNLSEERLTAKGHAAQNLNEMIEIATGRQWEKAKHSGKHATDAKYGFYKYDTRFKVGRDFYDAQLLIRNDADGKKYLYDVLGIKKETAGQENVPSVKNNSAVAETSGLSNTTISQRNSNVNNNIRKNGENDTKYSLKTSKLYENTLEKPFVTEETRQAVEANRERFMYEGITNKETYERGKAEVERAGADEVRETLYGKGKWKADDVAAALAAFAEYQKKGETQKAVGLAAVLRQKMTEAGQAVQALKIVDKLTPEGKLLNFLKESDKLAQEGVRRSKDREKIEQELKGKKPEEKEAVYKKYKIPHVDEETKAFVTENLQSIEKLNTKQDLINLIQKQSEKRGTKAKVKDLQKVDFVFLKELASRQVLGMVADQIPKSTARKLSTYQAMSHLLNPRTMIRNLTSNAVFDVLDTAANNVAFGFDAMMGAFTKNKTVGIDRGWLEKGRLKAANDRGRKSKLAIQLGVDMSDGDKYNLDARRSFENKGIGKALNAAERGMSYGLQTTDEWNKGAITHSAEQALRRRKGIAFDDAEIQRLAQEEAKYRTFQDDNAASNVLKGLKDTLNMAGIGEKKQIGRRQVYEFGLGDLVQKYTQVPGALIMRSVEYSPLGYAKALGNIVQAARSRSFTPQQQRKLAMNLGRATTGTGFILAFAALSQLGIFTGEQDSEEKRLKNLQNAEGISSMQINLSGLGRLIQGKDPKPQKGDVLESVGFLEPMNTLMAMGYDLAQSDGGIKSWKDMLEKKTFEQIVDIPTMQTAKSLVQGLQYDTPPGEILLGIGIDSATGFIPSVVRQSANFFDPVQRDVYNESDSTKKYIGKVKNVVPGAKNTLNPKVTPFGEEKTNSTGNRAADFFNTFFNPGSAAIYQPSEISGELYRMGELYGESVLPKTAPKSFSRDGEKIEMSGKEYADFAKVYGKSANASLKAAVNSDLYQNADDDGKSKLLEAAIAEADDAAKEILWEHYKNGAELKAETDGEAYLEKIQANVIDAQIRDLQDEVREAYKASQYYQEGKSYSEVSGFKKTEAYRKYDKEVKKLRKEKKRLEG